MAGAKAPEVLFGATRLDNHGVNRQNRRNKPSLIAANPPVTPAISFLKQDATKQWEHNMALGRVLFVSLVAIVLTTGPTYGAELKKLTPPGFGNYEMLFLTGRIESGDGDAFDEFAKNVERATVVLKSEAGVVGDALQIGVRIRQNNWATMVLPDDECYSACALIWIAGARRYMSQSSTIGFHAA